MILKLCCSKLSSKRSKYYLKTVKTYISKIAGQKYKIHTYPSPKMVCKPEAMPLLSIGLLDFKILKILGMTTEVSFSNHSIALIIYRNNKVLHYKEVLLLNESLFEHTKLNCTIGYALTKARDGKNITLQNDVFNCPLVQYGTAFINFLLLSISRQIPKKKTSYPTLFWRYCWLITLKYLWIPRKVWLWPLKRHESTCNLQIKSLTQYTFLILCWLIILDMANLPCTKNMHTLI